MLTVQLDMLQTGAAGAAVYVVGRYLVKHSRLLTRYCIPEPVVGGLLFAILHLVLFNLGVIEVSFEPGASTPTLQNLFMVCFFTTVGFSVSFSLLKKGGGPFVIFLAVASLLIVVQNVVGGFMAGWFGLDPRLGIAMGSVPLVGGIGTSGAFGPLMEQEYGVDGAMVVAIACATYGIISGSIIGNPLARHEILSNNLKPDSKDKTTPQEIQEETDEAKMGARVPEKIDPDKFVNGGIAIMLAMGIGTLVNALFKSWGISFPAYIGPMIIAAIIRNYFDASDKHIPMEEIDILGNVALCIFLTMAIMGLKLWQLQSLALPMIVILLAETAVTLLFAHFVCFNIMGRNYDAACLTTGMIGFGMGSTPNAMANLEALCSKYGYSPKAFFIVPIVGGMFIDFTNSFLIVLFLNLF